MKNGLGGQVMQLDSQKQRSAWRNSETGIASPCSTKSWKMTVSRVPSYGRSSPSAEHNWMTAWLCSILRFSNSYTSASAILHFFHPMARSGASSTWILDIDFLGAILVSRAGLYELRSGAEREAQGNREKVWKVQEVWICNWQQLGVKRVKTLGSYHAVK